MIVSLIGLYEKFQTHIKQLEGKHIHDAIKIIFSPEESKMIEGIKQLQSNISSLSSKDPSEIASVEEFVKQLLLGDSTESKIKNGASSAKTLVETQDVEELLKKIEGLKDLIEPLKAVLGTMSQSNSSAPTSPS